MIVKLLVNIEHKVILDLLLTLLIDTFKYLYNPKMIDKTFKFLEEIIGGKFYDIGSVWLTGPLSI